MRKRIFEEVKEGSAKERNPILAASLVEEVVCFCQILLSRFSLLLLEFNIRNRIASDHL